MKLPSELFGVLNVNKSQGLTSRDVVNTIQRLVRPAKCGHAGTLDPLATGVLLVCVGPATRLVSLLQDASKTYVAEFILGLRSDTDDATGTIQRHTDDFEPPAFEDVLEILHRMTGVVQQIPPAFSAVHVNGRRAYEVARQGKEVLLSPRPVEIHAMDIRHYEWPRLVLEIVCGSGTYIRSIARDLGEQLGCGGLMSRLERTRIGSFTVNSAIHSDQLSMETVIQYLHSPVTATTHLTRYRCTTADACNVERGKQITCDPLRLSTGEIVPHVRGLIPTHGALNEQGNQPASNPTVALLSETGTELLALAEWLPDRSGFQPRTVLIPRS